MYISRWLYTSSNTDINTANADNNYTSSNTDINTANPNHQFSSTNTDINYARANTNINTCLFVCLQYIRVLSFSIRSM